MKKPRVRFCWLCGRKLWGNHHVEFKGVQDGLIRTLHKFCGKLLDNDPAYIKVEN